METSPLPMKGWTFLSVLGTYDHWAVRVLKRTTHTYSDTGDPFILFSSPRTTKTYCWAFSSGAVTIFTCFYDCRGWDSNTQPFTCMANVLVHCAINAMPLFMWFSFSNITAKMPIKCFCHSVRWMVTKCCLKTDWNHPFPSPFSCSLIIQSSERWYFILWIYKWCLSIRSFDCTILNNYGLSNFFSSKETAKAYHLKMFIYTQD